MIIMCSLFISSLMGVPASCWCCCCPNSTNCFVKALDDRSLTHRKHDVGSTQEPVCISLLLCIYNIYIYMFIYRYISLPLPLSLPLFLFLLVLILLQPRIVFVVVIVYSNTRNWLKWFLRLGAHGISNWNCFEDITFSDLKEQIKTTQPVCVDPSWA